MYNLIEYTSLIGLLYCIKDLDSELKIAINPTEHYPILYTSLTLDEIVNAASVEANMFSHLCKEYMPPLGDVFVQAFELQGLSIDEHISAIRSDYAVAKSSVSSKDPDPAEYKNKANGILTDSLRLAFLYEVDEIPNEEFELALLHAARRYVKKAGLPIDSVFSRRYRKDMPSDSTYRKRAYTSPVLSLLTLLGLTLFDSVPDGNFRYSIPGSVYTGDKLTSVRYPQWTEPISVNTLRTLIQVTDYDKLHRYSLLTGFYEVVYVATTDNQTRPDNAVFIAA